MTTRLLLLTTLAAALAACGSVPERNVALDQARTRLDSARREPALVQNAPEALQRAQGAIDRADKARRDGEPTATVDHLAYLAQQRITIAQEAAASQQAQAVAAGASAESDRMRLALRTQEADTAQRQLNASERENARQGADLAQADRNAQADQARLAQADREAQANQARLAQADRDAQANQARLARRDERVEGLEQQLKDLNAKKTERGIVVTLGDMLFDTGQARLQPEGARSMARLADFMKRNPQRQAAIDGYTDDVGSEASNQALSDRRAQAVQSALVGLGVEPARLRAQGHGESSPIAPNTSAGGRQSNRRVEIVFAAEAGDLLAR